MSQPVTLQLTEPDQQLLLQIARNAVVAFLAGRTPSSPGVTTGPLTESRGIFVSLHKSEELRGCIGNLFPVSPLYRTAAECAIAAAVGDPRFMPLMSAELPSVEFEISVLSPMRNVSDIGEIEIGTHGLLVRNKNTQGVLLPQVATLYGWDRERFLSETCKKAGMGSDEWKRGATVESFSALVFNERQFHLTAI